MSNGDVEPRPDNGAPDQTEAPTPVSKAPAVKTATKKRTSKTAAARTTASKAAAKRPVVKRTTAKGSTRTTAANTRVRLGHSEMFVSREVAGALSDKDLKRLRAIFKRTLKRARKTDTKKKR